MISGTSSAGDTIFALASGRLPAALAIVRVSGPKALSCLQDLGGRLPKPREVISVQLRDPLSGARLDHGVAIYFRGPASATGEDVVEFQLHGSQAIVARLLECLGRIDGCRAARPGEFTRRAFLHGKLNLAQVEAVADLIAANSQVQLDQAIKQYSGVLARQARIWRSVLIGALANLEAMIEFPDEEDAQGVATERVRNQLEELANDLATQLRLAATSERIRGGLQVVIVGEPNVGKSSLLNYLVGRKAAIVTDVAGTTRDPIEVEIALKGEIVRLIDTAGVRETRDVVETAGIQRTLDVVAGADLVIHVRSAIDSKAKHFFDSSTKRIEVINKVDLEDTNAIAATRLDADVRISCITGEGIPALLDRIAAMIDLGGRSGESGLLVRQRHIDSGTVAHSEIVAATCLLTDDQPELACHHLAEASRAIEELIGEVTNDDILDRVFHDFCIGK